MLAKRPRLEVPPIKMENLHPTVASELHFRKSSMSGNQFVNGRQTKSKWFHGFGPGFLVTAAFIGPGTVTTASTAGANFGFALVWTLVFSIAATIVLQEMSARLGTVTK
jgi:hypothetical protein